MLTCLLEMYDRHQTSVWLVCYKACVFFRHLTTTARNPRCKYHFHPFHIIRGRYFVKGKGLKRKHASKLLLITEVVLRIHVKPAVLNVSGFLVSTLCSAQVFISPQLPNFFSFVANNCGWQQQ